MVIVENNYIPKYRIEKHVGWRVTCPSCKSVLKIEESDLSYCRDGGQDYVCPCCRSAQYFDKSKSKKETWEKQVKY